MQKEIDFMMKEQNQRELEISEVKERLRKREDELRDLKQNLNTQISSVYDQYQAQIEELTAAKTHL